MTPKPSFLSRFTREISSGGTVFVLPAALLSLVLIAYPFFNAVWISFTDNTVGNPIKPFIGLKNYHYWVTHPHFWEVFLNTFIYAGGTVLFAIIFGFAIGLSLHKLKFARDFWGAVILIPWIIPTVVTTLVWLWMFNPMAGVLNYVLTATGMSEYGLNWLGNPILAWVSVLTVSAWRYTPYFGLVILAARKEVPDDYYEVAQIDGAGAFSQFFFVTVPMVWKVLFFTSILMFVRVAYDFVVVYVLTRGGPVGETEIISILTFNIAFDTGQMGLGVAAPLLMFPLFAPMILIVTGSMVRSIVGIK